MGRRHRTREAMLSALRTASRRAQPTFRMAAASQRFSPLQARQFATFLPQTEVEERVISVLQGFEKVDSGKLSPTAHFKNDLGLDSLDTVEVVMAVEEEFAIEIPDAEAEKIQSCEEAIKYVAAHPQAK